MLSPRNSEATWPRLRVRVRIVSTAGVLAALLAIAAPAALSRSLGSDYQGNAGRKGVAVYSLQFKVASNHKIQKIIAALNPKAKRPGTANAGTAKLPCVAPPQAFTFKSVHVDSQGRFKDKTRLLPFNDSAVIRGKFVSDKKASGTLTACTPKLAFTVNRK
jgi:hypothetical protein